jgi:hypothetical protein
VQQEFEIAVGGQTFNVPFELGQWRQCLPTPNTAVLNG